MADPVLAAEPKGVRTAVALQRSRGQLQKLRRPGRLKISKRPELGYRKALNRAIAELSAVVRDVIIPEIPSLVAGAPEEMRADALGDELSGLIDRAELVWAGSVDNEGPARAAAEEVGSQNQKNQRQAFRTVLGVDPVASEPFLGPLVDDFVQRNARLIRRVSADFLAKVEAQVGDGVRAGRRVESIQRDLERNFLGSGTEVRKAKKRAKLIARDQVSKYQGDLSRIRQTRLGVTRYIWRTSRDARVRPEHAAREGKIFSWSRPPDDGHPGQPINCRCHAEPVLSDLVDDAPSIGPAGGFEIPASSQPVAAKRRTKEPKPRAVPPKPAPNPKATLPRSGTVIELSPKQTEARRNAEWLRNFPQARDSAKHEERRDWMLWEWVHGSSRRTSIMLKRAAIEEFGLEGVPYQRSGVEFRIPKADRDRARGDLRRLYTATQAQLKKQGKSSVRLYRGLKTDFDVPGSVSAWTSDRRVAQTFAGKGGRVIAEEVPASKILVTHESEGWVDGVFGPQSEFLVLE